MTMKSDKWIDQLYKRSFDFFVLKCIDPDEALAHKILRQGYFWPVLGKDCKEFIKKFTRCQLFNNVQKQALVLPSSVLSPIPFAMWGIDIMGYFPKAKNKLQYVMVAVDYMTKWAEAKALRNITHDDAIKFVNNHIITDF